MGLKNPKVVGAPALIIAIPKVVWDLGLADSRQRHLNFGVPEYGSRVFGERE
jgi:hypothetical protein